MNIKTTLQCIVLVAVAAAPALGDNIFPPDWRGEYGTIMAEWDDWGPAGPGPGLSVYTGDEITANPGGFDPEAPAAYASWGDGTSVQDEFSGRQSVLEVNWDGGMAPVSVGLLNYDWDNPEKRIRLQVTSMGPEVLNFYLASGDWDPGEPQWSTLSLEKMAAVVSETNDHDDGWVTRAYDFTIEPNPLWEAVLLDWGFNTGFDPVHIDQIVIDTWCVPEPSSTALLSAFVLVTLVFFSRKRS